jgi:membrane-bound inhibitor of C-type lysozyme
MFRTLSTSIAACLLLAGAAHAETTPPAKPGTKPETPAKKPDTPPTKSATPGKGDKTAAKVNRVTYSCDGGVTMTVTYPPEAQAKTKPVKIAMKDTTYFVRPGKDGAAGKFENTKIKLVFQTKGDEASLEREGKALAEKCKASKPAT